MSVANPHKILGSFIRAHREHLPVQAKAIGRRRTPGWRREELLALMQELDHNGLKQLLDPLRK